MEFQTCKVGGAGGYSLIIITSNYLLEY